MRKFLAAMLSLVMIIVCAPVVANATEYSEYVESDERYFEGETEVGYHVYSTYYVTIPTSIGEDDDSGTITVTMDNIEEGYHINVYVTNLNQQGNLEVYSDSGYTGYLNVLYNNGQNAVSSDGLLTSFYPADYDYALNATTDVSLDSVDGAGNKAGLYSGTICFRVECVAD